MAKKLDKMPDAAFLGDPVLEGFLDSHKRIQFQLEQRLDAENLTGIILAVVDAADFPEANTGLVGYFEKRKMPGVFVSVNKPIATLLAPWPANSFVSQSIDFVDCISQMSGTRELVGPHVHYLESPQQLVELSGKISELLSKKTGKRFLVIDSLSTLLIYNRPESIEKFVHAVTNKIRGMPVFAVLLMIKTAENLDVQRIVSQFCDHVIEVREKGIGMP